MEDLFRQLRTLSDVAALLGCSRARLRHLLYRMAPSKRYRAFEISKKTGGVRQIRSPIPEIKELQRRLHELLLQMYRPKRATHGFALGRSILTNARDHVGANTILNLDLADFFPSIHIGRVIGRFRAKPFECAKQPATILAQLCCDDGTLPQGAPTSPTISNLICGGMDVELQRFANERRCRYTRYADDITFSTRALSFPSDIARPPTTEGAPIVGSTLEAIINKHDFLINHSKVRLQTRSQRQVVTGLKINRFPNPSRKLFSEIRAMLHALEKFGPDLAQQDYTKKFAKSHRASYRGAPSFLYALRGKIHFVGAIRGRSSPTFIRFARKIRDLAPGLVQDWDVRTLEERIGDALWVLETDEKSTQGTGFFLQGVGLITCEHVIHEGTVAFKASAPLARYEVRVRYSEPTIDLAICDIDCKNVPALNQAVGRSPNQGDKVILAGFPNFKFGNTPHINSGIIVSFGMWSAIRRLIISSPIISGNSGGPVLNSDGGVIGVAVTGTDRPDLPTETADFGVIPIDALAHLSPQGIS
jgi:S1-C subfamily serine protease